MLDMTFQYGETIEVVKHAMTNGSEYTTCKQERDLFSLRKFVGTIPAIIQGFLLGLEQASQSFSTKSSSLNEFVFDEYDL